MSGEYDTSHLVDLGASFFSAARGDSPSVLTALANTSPAPAPAAPLWDWLMVLAGLVLTVGTAIFVAAEFSLVALDPAQVEQAAGAAAGDQQPGGPDRGDGPDRRGRPTGRSPRRLNGVLSCLQHLSEHLSGAQVGITITTILLGYTTQVALVRIFERSFHGWVAPALATSLAVALSLLLVNVFSMVFGELVPKNLALAQPLRVATLVSPFQRAFTWVFKPVIWALNTMANRVIRSFGVEPLNEASSARSASELAALVRHSAEEGTFDLDTASIFTRSVGLGRLSAEDVMTNRGRMETLPESATAEDVVRLAKETGHSRFPVIGEDSDDVLGFVHLRRAVAVPFERRDRVPVTSQSLLTTAPRVPETMPLAPLLVELRDTGLQMAVVVDEYGGTAGLVTLEDVVEEIVGEVADEHDFRRRGIRSQGPERWLVEGTLRPDEVADRIGLRLLDEGPYETLAGLVLYHLGRIAKEGDQVVVPGELGWRWLPTMLGEEEPPKPQKKQVVLEVKRLENLRIAQIVISLNEDLTVGGDDE